MNKSPSDSSKMYNEESSVVIIPKNPRPPSQNNNMIYKEDGNEVIWDEEESIDTLNTTDRNNRLRGMAESDYLCMVGIPPIHVIPHVSIFNE